jgi:hypothetical protein
MNLMQCGTLIAVYVFRGFILAALTAALGFWASGEPDAKSFTVPDSRADGGVMDQNSASWNQLISWLRDIDAVRLDSSDVWLQLR